MPKKRFSRVAVAGGGSWGTALAHSMAGCGLEACILVRDAAQAHEVNTLHTNSRYLARQPLHPNVRATIDPAVALEGADICLLAVPCQYMSKTLYDLAGYLPARCVPVCASKGIEVRGLRRMSELVAEAWPDHAAGYSILSGPSFADEVVRGKPTAVVLACADEALGKALRETLSSPSFRVYSSTDVTGVELGGALKNVIAIAAGVADGLGLGYNARAALITRGLAEISRIGLALGARASSFMGLSGMGDLVLTCTGDLSRNRQVGIRLAQGETLDQIVSSMHMVAEGVKTTQAVCALGQRLDVDLPIAQTMYRVLHDGASPAQAVHQLMTRDLKEE